MNKLKNDEGFTLIELIVVIAILSIGLTIASPNLRGFLVSKKLDKNVSQFVNTIREVRMLTMTEGNRYKMQVYSNGFGIYEKNPDGAYEEIKHIKLDKGFVIEDVNGIIPSGGRTVKFTYIGGTTSFSGSCKFFIKNNSFTKQKSIAIANVGGRVTVGE